MTGFCWFQKENTTLLEKYKKQTENTRLFCEKVVK